MVVRVGHVDEHDEKLPKHLLRTNNFEACSCRGGSDCGRRSESFAWSGDAIGVSAAAGRERGLSRGYSTRHSRGFSRTPQVIYRMSIRMQLRSSNAGMGQSSSLGIQWWVMFHMPTVKYHRIKTEITYVLDNRRNNGKLQRRYFRLFTYCKISIWIHFRVKYCGAGTAATLAPRPFQIICATLC